MAHDTPIRMLVFGPTGQIGWELTRVLPRHGEVIAADRSRIDLTNPATIVRTLADARPDVIVNAAGYTSVDGAESEPELAAAVNAIAPGIIAEHAAALGAGLVHYSTDYVFDGAKGSPYTTDDEPAPLNVYGRTKLEGERRIVGSGASYVILRTSWVYSRRRRNFLTAILSKARTETEIRVVDDQFGCPSWSRLIAQATAAIIDRAAVREGETVGFGSRVGIYHVSCHGVTSWYGLARRVIDGADVDPKPIVTPIPTTEYASVATRPPYSALECERTRAVFGVDLGPWEDAVDDALRTSAGDDAPATTRVEPTS